MNESLLYDTTISQHILIATEDFYAIFFARHNLSANLTEDRCGQDYGKKWEREFKAYLLTRFPNIMRKPISRSKKGPDSEDWNDIDVVDGTAINIKFSGSYSKAVFGQPNVTSLQKFYKRLDDDTGYWMLRTKVFPDVVRHDLVNLYDALDCLSYNDGPGQLMLKEKLFYEKAPSFRVHSIDERREKLDELWATAYLQNRDSRWDRLPITVKAKISEMEAAQLIA